MSSQIFATMKMGNIDNIQNNTCYKLKTTQSIKKIDHFMTLIGFGRVWMGCKSIYKHQLFYEEYFNLKLYQLCFDGLPTMCLQLYIALVSETSSLALVASIAITFASITFTIFRIFHKNSAKHSFNKTRTFKVNADDCNLDNRNVINAISTVPMKYSRISQTIMCLFLLTDVCIRTFPFVFATFMIRTIVVSIGIHSFVKPLHALRVFVIFVLLAFIWFIMIIITIMFECIMLRWMVNTKEKSKSMIKRYYVFASCFSSLFNVIFVLPLKRFDQKYSFQRCVFCLCLCVFDQSTSFELHYHDIDLMLK